MSFFPLHSVPCCVCGAAIFVCVSPYFPESPPHSGTCQACRNKAAAIMPALAEWRARDAPQLFTARFLAGLVAG